MGKKSEALCLKELVPGGLTCPHSSSPPWLGESSSQGPVSSTSPSANSGIPPELSGPLGFPSWAEKWDCGSPNPQRPGHSPDMPSLWQAASGRPGQRTERRRRSKGSRSRPERDKSQLQSKLPGSGVGALAGGLAWTGLPWEESGWCLLSQSLRPPGGWPTAGAVCGRQTQGLGVLKVRAWEEEERELRQAPFPATLWGLGVASELPHWKWGAFPYHSPCFCLGDLVVPVAH